MEPNNNPLQTGIWALVSALFSSVLTFITASFWWKKQKRQVIETATRSVASASEQRMHEMETQIAVLDQKVLPIASAFQAILIQKLTHLHEPRTDELLLKLGPPFILTVYEEMELTELLRARTLDMGPLIDDVERAAAGMLPLLIPQVRAECATGLKDLDMMVVGVPKTETK